MPPQFLAGDWLTSQTEPQLFAPQRTAITRELHWKCQVLEESSCLNLLQ